MDEYRHGSSNTAESNVEAVDLFNILHDVIYGIKKLWWVILALTVIFAAKSYFTVSLRYNPTYTASATVSVMGLTGDNSSGDSARQMAELFPYILSSGILNHAVALDIGTDYVPGSINVANEPDLNLLNISVTSSDAQKSYDILQSVIKNYPDAAKFVLGETKLIVLDETGVPTDSGKKQFVRESYKRGAKQGALLGLAVLAVYVFTRNTVKNTRELRNKLNINGLGSLPYIPEKKRRKKKVQRSINILSERIPQAYVEAMRKLRTRVIKELDRSGFKTLLVTSSRPDEGKTSVAVNLAASMAQSGKSVILADCDLRNPSVANILNKQDIKFDIKDVLKGNAELDDALCETKISGDGSLKVLYGSVTGGDAKLLSSNEMKKLVEDLSGRADIVILDAAPSELLMDASVVSKYADASLYVVKYDFTKLRQIRNGLQSLSLGKSKIIGYVMNADKTEGRKSYGYGYGKYRSYGYGSHYSRNKKDDTDGRVIKD